jgi:2-polyprenyl-3-methyl-5-hydroxy-6-metoxy-1,4-benzoquinol methylase
MTVDASGNGANENGASENTNTAYVLGHSDRELARLERQAAFFGDMTRDGLLRAGIAPGMRVLELGCGVGDVSSIAAELVGPRGEVVGIDISEDALTIATRRMHAAGHDHVRFAHSTLEEFADYGDFDAVIGRFILIHVPDPAALLGLLAQRVRPGATIAFIEMDVGTASALPPLPLMERCVHWIMEVYRRAGRESEMGSKLFSAFRSAGLAPAMTGFTRIASEEDQDGFAFLTESVRSMLPAMEKLGIARPDEVSIDTLRERLVADAAGGSHCIFYPRLIAAWASTATAA